MKCGFENDFLFLNVAGLSEMFVNGVGQNTPYCTQRKKKEEYIDNRNDSTTNT